MAELFRLHLPEEPESEHEVVALFPDATEGVEQAEPGALTIWLESGRERLAAGWRTTWVGDGLLGLRPRPVADLIRQFWTTPPPYIRDALVLRIPYTIYGGAAIALTAAAHLVLLVIGYPALLAAAALLVTIVVLIT